jgi:hypothetical protein
VDRGSLVAALPGTWLERRPIERDEPIGPLGHRKVNPSLSRCCFCAITAPKGESWRSGDNGKCPDLEDRIKPPLA